jgi:pimeloyl-ACP methyl ester carboxylesterase
VAFDPLGSGLSGWRTHLPDVTQVTIPRGLHFPICDHPALTAQHIAAFTGADVRTIAR